MGGGILIIRPDIMGYEAYSVIEENRLTKKKT
jgi:hypothetical protein